MLNSTDGNGLFTKSLQFNSYIGFVFHAADHHPSLKSTQLKTHVAFDCPEVSQNSPCVHDVALLMTAKDVRKINDFLALQ